MIMWSLCICSNLDDVVQLLSSVVEVLADVGGDLLTGVLHRKREDVLNHGLAPTASRTSLPWHSSKEQNGKTKKKTNYGKCGKDAIMKNRKWETTMKKERRQVAMQKKKTWRARKCYQPWARTHRISCQPSVAFNHSKQKKTKQNSTSENII